MELGMIYITGLAIVSARLGWYMHYHLDRFDWAYNKEGIWVNFALTSILWPVPLLLKPKSLLLPGDSFKDNSLFDRTSHERQLSEKINAIYSHHSPCGASVSFRPYGGHCTFVIPAAALAAELREKIQTRRGNANLSALLYWLENSSPDIRAVKPIPLYCDLIPELAILLHARGDATAWCWQCWQAVPKEAISKYQPPLHRGVNNKFYRCQQKHLLLSLEHFRIF